jgi:hypothetical protein
MRPVPLLLGGLVAGLIVLTGEVILNVVVLQDEMTALVQRFALPLPTLPVLAQAVLRLLLVGVLAVWMALTFDRVFRDLSRSAMVSGLCI